MKEAALCENMKNNIFSLIPIFYLIHVWKVHESMRYLQASYCARYKLGYHAGGDAAALLYGGQQ
jgi:hypothetical protein